MLLNCHGRRLLLLLFLVFGGTYMVYGKPATLDPSSVIDASSEEFTTAVISSTTGSSDTSDIFPSQIIASSDLLFSSEVSNSLTMIDSTTPGIDSTSLITTTAGIDSSGIYYSSLVVSSSMATSVEFSSVEVPTSTSFAMSTGVDSFFEYPDSSVALPSSKIFSPSSDPFSSLSVSSVYVDPSISDSSTTIPESSTTDIMSSVSVSSGIVVRATAVVTSDISSTEAQSLDPASTSDTFSTLITSELVPSYLGSSAEIIPTSSSRSPSSSIYMDIEVVNKDD